MTSAGVRSILLYGSHARGESDHESDVDVLVITSDRNVDISDDDLRRLAPKLPDLPLSVSIYEQSDLELMLTSGSLFAWHLKLEGEAIFGSDFMEQHWDRLRPFKDHRGELTGYLEIMEDLELAFSEYETSNEFDLAVIFTIVRNACIVLSNWIGNPKFGRLDCIETIRECFAWFPFSEKQIVELSHWKNAYERGTTCTNNLPTFHELSELIESTKVLVELGIEETTN